ncbi:hypothetical protein GQ53DRAFT_714133 [Thozetella sp. PMI_491]|nr:hypothetical protein GQ53DRAFT_714133 [Thozetella sp. PMI_491]
MPEQGDSEATPQRKRIAVACLRCRKRKIRCSGDPGAGLPCVNCKNAGAEQCQFLRVQSHEAPIRNGPGDYGYPIEDARAFANRHHAPPGVHYSLPSMASNDVPHHRGSSVYPPYPHTKSYYGSSVAGYGPAPSFQSGYYVEDHHISYPPQPVLASEPPPPMTMLPSHIGPRPSPSIYGSEVYADGGGSYGYGKNSTNLSHRADPSSFSFTPVTSSLPLNASDRLLPNPAVRSYGHTSGFSFVRSTPAVSTVSTSASPSVAATSPTTVGSDAASTASYPPSSYDSPFPAPGTTLPSHRQHSTPAPRANSEVYSSGGETIFSDHEHNLSSQGSSLDLHGYTYSDSHRGSSGNLPNGQSYLPSDSPHSQETQGSGAHQNHPYSRREQTPSKSGDSSRSRRVRAGSLALVDGHPLAATSRR